MFDVLGALRRKKRQGGATRKNGEGKVLFGMKTSVTKKRKGDIVAGREGWGDKEPN